jgi:tetratricopeptide (TPR) repeat protein
MALMLLVLLASIPSHALEGPCSDAEQRMASISEELSAENLSDAEQTLREMQRTAGECAEVLLAHARIAAAKGAMVEAEDFFERYADLAPNDAKAYSYHARFLLERGQPPRADALSKQALEVNSKDSLALAVRGEVLDMKGQTQEAMEVLEKACQLDPANVEAQFRLAMIYDRAKRLSDAVQHLKRVVETDPRDGRAWDYLALDLERLGDVEQADLAYRKGLAANRPGPHFDAFLDYNYGRFLMKRNDLGASQQHLDRAVELTPDVRAPWYERAKLNLRLKNYQQARDDAERSANIRDPRGVIIDLQLYVLLQQIYARLGDAELAEKYAKLSQRTAVPARKESGDVR